MGRVSDLQFVKDNKRAYSMWIARQEENLAKAHKPDDTPSATDFGVKQEARKTTIPKVRGAADEN